MNRITNSLELVELHYQNRLIQIVPALNSFKASISIFAEQEESTLSRNAISGLIRRHIQLHLKEKDPLQRLLKLLQGIPEGKELKVKRFYATQGLLQAVVDGNASIEQKQEVVCLMDEGKIRCSRKVYDLEGKWVWEPQTYGIKTVSISFSAFDYETCLTTSKDSTFWDKIPLKTAKWKLSDFKKANIRFLPGCVVRYGSYIGPFSIIAGLINTGAYLEGGKTMIDFGARVASGAQVGRNVKLGAGSGIEGINEPTGRVPSIIENNVIVGANCEISGIVEEGAIIGSGVVIAPGKKIFDLRTNEQVEPLFINYEKKEIKMPRIPAGRIAVSGVYQKKGSDFGISCILLLEKDADISHIERKINNDMYR